MWEYEICRFTYIDVTIHVPHVVDRIQIIALIVIMAPMLVLANHAAHQLPEVDSSIIL